MRVFTALAAAAALSLSQALPVFAADQITVSGEGEISAAPDMAKITLGVVSQGDEAGAAMQANGDQVAGILDQLKTAGVAEKDVQTSRLTLDPVYADRDPKSPGDTPAVQGFRAQNLLTVTIRDLTKLGPVLDAVMGAGANTLQGLSFSVADPAPLLDEARRAAVADARHRAELYADAAGVALGPVQSLTETGGVARPMASGGVMRMSEAKSVPVASGEVTVSAQVQMSFGVSTPE